MLNMADTERGIAYMFPQTAGGKTAPERNGNLAQTDSFQFAELSLEVKMAILRFNTDPAKAMMSLSEKLAYIRERTVDGNKVGG